MKNLFLIFLLLFSAELYSAEIAVFHNSDCENCVLTKELTLLPILKNIKIEYIEYDISIEENYELLLKIERTLNDMDNQDIPVVWFDNKLYSGKNEIENNLVAAITLAKKNNIETVSFNPTVLSKTETYSSQSLSQQIIYFYKTGCMECLRIEKDLKYLQIIDSALIILRYNIADTEAINIYEYLSVKFSVPFEKRFLTPALFAGSEYLTGVDLNIHKIKEALSSKNGSVFFQLTDISESDYEAAAAQKNILSRFLEFRIITVISAGLIDGINPCAFAVIIFFLSYFFILKKTQKEILFSGLCFIAGVFTAYSTIGAGLIEISYKLKITEYAGASIYYTFAAALMILGFINLYDYLLCLKGREKYMISQLPLARKLKIHKLVRASGSSKKIYMSVFICGLIVSVYEFGCTGQIYIPTIVYVMKTSDYKIKAYSFLLLYNAAFIIPLLITLLIVYRSAGATALLNFFNRNLKFSKLFTAILFFMFAVLFIILKN